MTLKDELETLNDVLLSVTAQQLRDAAGLPLDEDLSMEWSRRHTAEESVIPEDYPSEAFLDMKAFVVVHGAGWQLSSRFPASVFWFGLQGLSSFVYALTNFLYVCSGSFGHFQASRAKVNHGRLGTPFVNAGFVATRISVSHAQPQPILLALEHPKGLRSHR